MADQPTPKRAASAVDGKSPKPRVKRPSAKADSAPELPAPYAPASVMAAVPGLEATVRPAGETTASPPSSSTVTPAPIRADAVPPAAEMAVLIEKSFKDRANERKAAVVAWVTDTINKNKDAWEASMSTPGKWNITTNGYETTIRVPPHFFSPGEIIPEMQSQMGQRYPSYVFFMHESMLTVIIENRRI